MTVDTVIALEPSVKKRVEVFLNRNNLSLSEFINGMLVEFIEDNGLEDEHGEDWEDFYHKFAEALDNDPNPPSFVYRSEEELIEKIEEGLRDIREGRVYSFEEVVEELNRDYGYNL